MSNKEKRSLRTNTVTTDAIVSGLISIMGIGIRELGRRCNRSSDYAGALRRKKHLQGVIELVQIAQRELGINVRVNITIEPDGTGHVSIIEVDTPDLPVIN